MNQLEVKNRDPQTDEGVNLETISRTLLSIVAHLGKTQYTDPKSTEVVLQQAEVRQHSDLSDPASDDATSQG